MKFVQDDDYYTPVGEAKKRNSLAELFKPVRKGGTDRESLTLEISRAEAEDLLIAEADANEQNLFGLPITIVKALVAAFPETAAKIPGLRWGK